MNKDIKLKLEVDSKTGKAKIDKTTKSIKLLGVVGNDVGRKISKSFDGAKKSLKIFTVGLAAATTAMGVIAKKTLDSSDKIAKLADSIGISTDVLQEYSYAASLSGVSQELLNTSVVAFTKRLGEAKTGTGALTTFLKKYDSALLDQLKNTDNVVDGLDIFMNALGNAKDATDGAAMAAAGFSRGGIALLVMVKNGGEGLKMMQQEARELGIVISDKLLRNSESLNDSIYKITSTGKAFLTKVVLKLAPRIEDITNKVVDWIKENQKLIDQKVEDWVDGVKGSVGKLSVILGFVIDNMKSIVWAMGAIVSIELLGWGIMAAKIFTKIITSVIKSAAVITSVSLALKEVAAGILSYGRVLFSAAAATAALSAATKGLIISLGLSIGTAAAIGVGAGMILNSFKAIQREAEHCWNAVFFVTKYITAKMVLTFLQAIEKIKLAWVDLKNWFIKKFPEMAQFMGMEKGIRSYNLRITELKEKIVGIKKEYILLMKEINKFYAKKPLAKKEDAEKGGAVTGDVTGAGGEEDKTAGIAEAERLVSAYTKTTLEKTLAAIEERKEAALTAAKFINASEMDIAFIRSGANQESIDAIRKHVQVVKEGEEQKRVARLSTYEKWLEETKSMKDVWVEFNIYAAEALTSGSVDALWGFIDGTKSANRAMKDFATSFGKEILTMYAKSLMLEGIKTLLGGTTAQERTITANTAETVSVNILTKAYLRMAAAKGVAGIIGGMGSAGTGQSASSYMQVAKGGVFNQGKMTAFAKGGIVDSPTIFPMANGAGLMGEAGPEGVLPLKRTTSGSLGVQTTGGGQPMVQNITINAVDSKSFAEALERNPSAVINIVTEALEDNTSLVDTMRDVVG